MCIRKLIAKWRACRAGKDSIPPATAVAIFVSIISLGLIIGVTRWSWLLLDEQVRLRQEFMELKAKQEQINIQYEFWSDQLQKERAEIQKLKSAAE
jgi:hypothetical protein